MCLPLRSCRFKTIWFAAAVAAAAVVSQHDERDAHSSSCATGLDGPKDVTWFDLPTTGRNRVSTGKWPIEPVKEHAPHIQFASPRISSTEHPPS